MFEERVDALSRTIRGHLQETDLFQFACKILRRLGLQSVTLSHTLVLTPDAVPYWDGVTYRLLLSNNIPRILWPGKPEEKVGQAFGHRYRILWPVDTLTSWNLPWLTESFVNFGVRGTLLTMAIIGLLFAAIDRVFNRSDGGLCATSLGCALIFPLFYQESNISLMLGNWFVIAVCLIALCILARAIWFGGRAWNHRLRARYPAAPFGTGTQARKRIVATREPDVARERTDAFNA